METVNNLISLASSNEISPYYRRELNSVVIDYFCSSQKEYEELYNLAPVVKNLRRDADQVHAFFINYPENIDE